MISNKSACVLCSSFLIAFQLILLLDTDHHPVSAANINSTQLTFFPSDAINVTSPTTLQIYRGEDSIGVLKSAYPNGCGNDATGNYSDPTAYFELSVPIGTSYIYKIKSRAYGPDDLANSFWMFKILAGDTAWDPAGLAQLGIKLTTDGSYATSDQFCMYLPATPATRNHTIRLKPREVGGLIAWVRWTLEPPVSITRSFSICEQGVCDFGNPLPIRVIYPTPICTMYHHDTNYSNIRIEGATGQVYFCPTAGQLKSFTGEYYVDCQVPKAVVAGRPSELIASLEWPSSSLVPAAAAGAGAVRIAVTVPSPQEPANLWWIAAPIGVLLLVAIYLIYRWHIKWAVTKDAPRDDKNIGAMFISARNVGLMWEKAPATTSNALKQYDRIVRDAASDTSCYVAKKIGDSYLVVANEPEKLFRAASQIQNTLTSTNWLKILTGKDHVAIECGGGENNNNKHNQQQGKHGNNNNVKGSAVLNNNNRGGGRGNLRGSGQLNQDGNARESGSRVLNYSNLDLDLESSLHMMQNGNSNSNSFSGGLPSPPSNSHQNNNNALNNSSGNADMKSPRPSVQLPTAMKRVNSHGGSANNNAQLHESWNDSGTGTKSMALTAGSSHKTGILLESGIACSIAITIGRGRIQFHEAGTVSADELYEYSGDVIESAATIVDLAHPTQTLTTEYVEGIVSRKKKEVSTGENPTNNNNSSSNVLKDAETIKSELQGTLTPLGSKLLRGKAYRFVQFNPKGLEVLDCGLQDAAENADSMQAQLDAASSGFAQKIVTILYIEVHGLAQQAFTEDDRKAFVEKYKLIYKPINDIARLTGGTVVHISCSNVVIVFNAFSPSPLHVTRAATCLFQLRELFTKAPIVKSFNFTKLGFAAGLATGNCIVGSLETDKSHKQLFGPVWHQAQELSRLARPYALSGKLTCPCFAVWNARSDLNHNAQFQFVDVKPARDVSGHGFFDEHFLNQHYPIPLQLLGSGVGQQQVFNTNNNGANPSPTTAATAPAPPPTASVMRGIIALMKDGGSGNGDEDKEWMYDLEQQENANPYFHANEAYVWLISDMLAEAEDKWQNLLSRKLQFNENDEVNKCHMVGLKRLKEIFDEKMGGWDGYCKKQLLSASRAGFHQQQQQDKNNNNNNMNSSPNSSMSNSFPNHTNNNFNNIGLGGGGGGGQHRQQNNNHQIVLGSPSSNSNRNGSLLFGKENENNNNNNVNYNNSNENGVVVVDGINSNSNNNLPHHHQ